jgi:hypothetical protein
MAFGTEFLRGIVGKKHISSPAIARFNLGFEFVFLHCVTGFCALVAFDESD